MLRSALPIQATISPTQQLKCYSLVIKLQMITSVLLPT
jgi:hypothetical protein